MVGRRSRILCALGGASLVTASAVMRFGIDEGGVASAKDPKYTVPKFALDLSLRDLVHDDGHRGCLVSWQQPQYVAVRLGRDDDQPRLLG